VIAFESSAFGKQKVEHLPADIITKVGSLVQDFNVEQHYSLYSLALVCGIFTNPKQESQAMLLHWSPLIDYAERSLDGSSFEELLSVAKDFIKEKFTVAVTRFHDDAYNLMKAEYPVTCYHLLQRGKLLTSLCLA
jgi:hypothetical protein